MIYRLILPDWIKAKPDYDRKALPGVLEGKFTNDEVKEYNGMGYNAYYLPNYPSTFEPGTIVDGTHIDTFEYVFLDMDLKHGVHVDKDEFIKLLLEFFLIPSSIVDSGNGIHAYWHTINLDPMSFLRLQRRLCRHFDSDPAVSKLYQLMRVADTINWKNPDDLKLAELVVSNEVSYNLEQLDLALPKITPEDEAYCKLHHDKTYGLIEPMEISDELPSLWFKKFPKGSEGHSLFYGQVKDRSAADYRLAHLLFAAGMTKEEAMAVLTQTNKASSRSGIHRFNYAESIVSKVWLHIEDTAKASSKILSKNVKDILFQAANSSEELGGKRFPCSEFVDATHHGFRLTQVLGLVGGAGSGKTTLSMNYFKWFVEKNPNYIHLFVSLEQPETEIAERVQKISQGNQVLFDSIYILGNYNDDSTYRYLGLQEIEDHVKLLEKTTGRKVGCVVVDHIGVLKKESKNGEMQSLMDICQYMKAFATNTNTFLVMQSQTSREKAGIGDIELDKDAAYGTSMFEWFCDYIVTTWQPLKRIYDQAPDMTATCFKYCKIRHKNVKKDKLKEDVRYALMFDSDTETLRLLTEDEMISFDYRNKQAVNLRKQDKRTEPGAITRVTWVATKAEK